MVVRDKDGGAATDDFIGKFDVSISPGTKEVEIQGPMNMRNRGMFWLKVTMVYCEWRCRTSTDTD